MGEKLRLPLLLKRVSDFVIEGLRASGGVIASVESEFLVVIDQKCPVILIIVELSEEVVYMGEEFVKDFETRANDEIDEPELRLSHVHCGSVH